MLITTMLALAGLAQAADLTVQARVLDADGAPLSGDLTVEVVLYDAATDLPTPATELHRASAPLAPLTDGYVSVMLTDVPADDLEGDVWVEFQVDTVPMGARQPLTASPRAAVAEWVTTPATALQPYQGALRMPDGSSLASCAAYKDHDAWRGEDWQLFWIDPDGADTGVAPMRLRCDMAGGAWAVWEAQNGPWGWDRDGLICYDVELFSEGQAWQMSRYPHTEFEVVTDTDFWFQEDDSANPGSVYARAFSSVATTSAFDGSTSFRMDYTTSSNNHVDITWSPDGYDRIRANCAGSSGGCGTRNIPANGANSTPLFLTRIDANPSCSGATASSNTWSRNGTAFQGSRYEVRLR